MEAGEVVDGESGLAALEESQLPDGVQHAVQFGERGWHVWDRVQDE